jgi:hypothetical protein
MKRAFCITVATLLLALLNATANAQDTQEAQTYPCFVRTEGCVWDEYDRFQDKTIVTMTPLHLTFPPVLGYSSSMSVSIGAEFSSSGAAVKRPETITLAFITFISNPFADKKGVYLLIDGKSYPLGDVSLERESRNDYESKYSLQAPFEVVEKIATAKTVEIRIGSAETSLDEKVKAPFRRIVEVVPKKESVPSLAKDKAASRPKPTRSSPKRGRP